MSSRRIDIHHHIFTSSVTSFKLNANPGLGWRTPAENLPWSPERSLAFMDATGIDTAILSYPTSVFHGLPGPETCAKARELNATAARICKEHPGRFGFLAALPDPRDIVGGCIPVIQLVLTSELTVIPM